MKTYATNDNITSSICDITGLQTEYTPFTLFLYTGAQNPRIFYVVGAAVSIFIEEIWIVIYHN